MVRNVITTFTLTHFEQTKLQGNDSRIGYTIITRVS